MSHTHHGKWSEAGVPQKGWSCIGIDDLEESTKLCEMCESADIRYVHYMSHPDYPAVLGVGCVCAENMEEDYVRPKERERRLRTLAQRRRTWGRRRWRISSLGNEFLNTEGYNLVVFGSSRGWQVVVKHRDSGRQQLGHKFYGTEHEARDAALTALLWAKDHLK